MTTKTAGGKVTGILALTFEAQVALDVGDPVMVTGNYEVGLCDGSRPCIGVVSVANVKRDPTTHQYPVAKVPGDVTVEVRGFYVLPVAAGEAITAGETVGYGAGGVLFDSGVSVSDVGVSLMAAAAPGDFIDVLFM